MKLTTAIPLPQPLPDVSVPELYIEQTDTPIYRLPLSGREREMLERLSYGHTTRQIADELHISYDTVETHRRNIMRKLGVNNIVAAVAHALRQGIIE